MQLNDELKRRTFPLVSAAKQPKYASHASTVNSWNSFARLSAGKSGSLHSYSTVTTLLSTMPSGKLVKYLYISQLLPNLPEEIWMQIFSYLDAISLCRCQRVTTKFGPLVLNADRWQALCLQKRLNAGPGMERLWDSTKFDIGRWWKEIYIEGVVTRRNWITGNHKKRLVEIIDDPKDVITCFKFDSDRLVVGSKLSRLLKFHPDTLLELGKTAIFPETTFKSIHTKPVLCLDFDTPSGLIMASGDAAGNLAVWNLLNGELIAKKKRAHDKGITCVMALGTMHIITAGFDKMIRLYKLEKNFNAQDSSNSIDSAFVGESKKSSLWRRIFNRKSKGLDTRLALVKEFRGHKGEIYCMKMAAQKTLFATGATDHLINIYDIKSGECKRTLKGHTDTVTCFASTGHLLFSGSLDCTIRKWNVFTGDILATFTGHARWIKSMDISGPLLISGGWEETIFLWHFDTNSLIHKIKLDMGPISNIKATDTTIYASCREEGFQRQLLILDFARTPKVIFPPPSANNKLPPLGSRKVKRSK